MAPRSKPLLPTARDLALLSDEKVKAILEVIDREGERANRYAVYAMTCGTVSLLGCFGLFGYLVMQGHERAASLIFGTTVVGLIGKIVLARL